MINSNFHLICVLMTAIHPESKYFELLTVGKCENALHYGAYQRFWPVPSKLPNNNVQYVVVAQDRNTDEEHGDKLSNEFNVNLGI